MAGQFEGKVVLVTGGGRGIGRAAALLFAAEGGRVVVSDIDEAAANDTVDLIRRRQAEGLAIACDVSDADSCARLVSGSLEHYGRLDVAFNNAGVADRPSLAAEVSEAEWGRVLRINLTGVFLSMKHEIPALLQSGGGAIVNTASVAGLVGAPLAAAYCAAKHGVIGLTRAAALDYIGQGIRINALCPGATDTDMLRNVTADPAVKQHILGTVPIKRVASAEEIARTAVFLASDASSYLVGQALAVDGGVTVQ
ncbi:glucose 1-dehydrogenase [Phenylobacterium montanum]|uniref:D-xylose 1-dehydrogenase n=1 Tax=Phenylobacterium montanum TaxID=2823693 RepID=A0A975IWU3_9CAUL|nr:glucose 1-dehydrogenase [Caulobacter sp. S6]QUD90258.1 SDR family oxidoreductase [Caulobacter sp. S6]